MSSRREEVSTTGRVRTGPEEGPGGRADRPPVADRLRVEYCPDCVKRSREVPQLKDVFDYDERWKLLEGLHEVVRTKLEGRKVLLFDDLFRSGRSIGSTPR